MNWYSPAAFVSVVRDTDVDALVNVRVAFGTAAPLGSRTAPTTVPVSIWAVACVAESRIRTQTGADPVLKHCGVVFTSRAPFIAVRCQKFNASVKTRQGRDHQ